MVEIISILNSFASICFFFCIIIMFAKIIGKAKPSLVMVEIVLVSIIILVEVALVHFKSFTVESDFENMLIIFVYMLYAMSDVNLFQKMITKIKKEKAKEEKGKKFDKKV